jgi:hypothetical protein
MGELVVIRLAILPGKGTATKQGKQDLSQVHSSKWQVLL